MTDQGLVPAVSAPSRIGESGPAIAQWRALGTGVVLGVTVPAALPSAEALLVAELAAIDVAASRFRPDSELTAVNLAAGTPCPISPLLLHAIEVALDAARTTNGVVDPTLGHAVSAAGYDRTFELIPQVPGPVGPSRPCVPGRVTVTVPGWKRVEVDRTRGSVTVPAGVLLDLGATAKALTADRAAALIHQHTGAGVLVSLGGDIAIAGSPPAGGWAILVTDDSGADPGTTPRGSQIVQISTGALATSGTEVRRWVRDGETLHHIIDPRTQMPARSVWRTVTVAAPTCVAANVASTAAVVLGDDALPWLTTAGLPARLVNHHGEVTRLNGWPAAAEGESTDSYEFREVHR